MKYLIKDLRLASKLTQKEFALKYSIPLSTLRKWEQGYSSPNEYVTYYIASTLPEYNKQFKKIIGKDDRVFYLDEERKRVSDASGNIISFSEPVEGVMECNLPVYLEDLFDEFYRIQKKFNSDLKYDKKEKIKWR